MFKHKYYDLCKEYNKTCKPGDFVIFIYYGYFTNDLISAANANRKIPNPFWLAGLRKGEECGHLVLSTSSEIFTAYVFQTRTIYTMMLYDGLIVPVANFEDDLLKQKTKSDTWK